MYTIDEKSKEYRHGDHGPKYLMQGPDSNFGIISLLPGEVVTPHVHKVMEENFYVLEGQVSIEVEGIPNILGPGQFIHLEAGEFHKISNPFDEPMKMIVTAAPYTEGDKYLEK